MSQRRGTKTAARPIPRSPRPAEQPRADEQEPAYIPIPEREIASSQTEPARDREQEAPMGLYPDPDIRMFETRNQVLLEFPLEFVQPIRLGFDPCLMYINTSSTMSAKAFEPQLFDVENITATYQNGFLTLYIPRPPQGKAVEEWPTGTQISYHFVPEGYPFTHTKPAPGALVKFQKSIVAPEDLPDTAEPQAHFGKRQMQDSENITIRPDGTLLKAGVSYRPLSTAATEAQAHPTTVLRWIKNQTEFQGQPLQSHYFAPAHTYYLAEESIGRIANRFVKWPSQEPAGPVTLGETKDKSGFIGMSEAAEIAGVSKRTMWLWVSQDKAPTDKPLDIIKCPASDYFYIRERNAYDLKKVVPRSGLHRGRRPQLAL